MWWWLVIVKYFVLFASECVFWSFVIKNRNIIPFQVHLVAHESCYSITGWDMIVLKIVLTIIVQLSEQYFNTAKQRSIPMIALVSFHSK